MSEVRTTSSSLVSADELAGSCCHVSTDSQSVDTGYVSCSTRSLYVTLTSSVTHIVTNSVSLTVISALFQC